MDHGTYLLATTDADLKRDDVINVRTAFLTGEDADKKMLQTLTLYRDGMDWKFWLDGEEQYATLQQLGLYSPERTVLRRGVAADRDRGPK